MTVKDNTALWVKVRFKRTGKKIFKNGLQLASGVFVDTLVFYVEKVDVNSFSFTKEQRVLVVDLLNNCDRHITHLMAWKIEMGTCCFRKEFIPHVTTVGTKSLCKGVFGLANVLSFGAVILLTFNEINNVPRLAVKRFSQSSVGLHGLIIPNRPKFLQ